MDLSAAALRRGERSGIGGGDEEVGKTCMFVGGMDCRTDASPFERGSPRDIGIGIAVLAENERERKGAGTTTASVPASSASTGAVSGNLGTGGVSEGNFGVSGGENDDGDVTGRALFRRRVGPGGGGGKKGCGNGASGPLDGMDDERWFVIED